MQSEPGSGLYGPGVELQGSIEQDEDMSRPETPDNEANVDGNDPDFLRDRRDNDQRLKSRFEDIFEKYAQDFTGVGDEIDIETGDIVVDNGHLQRMQHEADTGQGQSGQFVKEFAAELEHVSDEGSESEQGEELEATDSEEDAVGDAPAEDAGAAARADSRIEATEVFLLDPLLRELSQAAMAAEPTEEAHNTSTIRKSQQADPSVDAVGMSAGRSTIEALGVTIATELAKVMDGGMARTRNKGKRKDPKWDFPDLPVFKRLRTTEPQSVRPLLKHLERLLSPASKDRKEPSESIWAPQHFPRYLKPREPKAVRQLRLGEQQQTAALELDTDEPSENGGEAELTQVIGSPLKTPRECSHCHIKATTAWRPGPDGDTLCNACGMYWYRYDLLRPLRPVTPEGISEPGSDEEGRQDDSHYSANTSRRISTTKTGQRHSRFSVEEDALLIKLKEIDQLSWERIGDHFPARYAKTLHNLSSLGREALIEQGFSFEKSVNPAEEEGEQKQTDELRDEQLVQLRIEEKLDWSAIADRMPGLTASWIEKRYNFLVGSSTDAPPPTQGRKRKRPNPVHANAPRNHYRSYTQEEDELLIKLREIDKLPWEILAQEFTERTWLSLQKRYVRTLAQRHRTIKSGGDDPYTYLFLHLGRNDEDEDVRLGPAGRRRMERFLNQRREDDEMMLRYKDEEGLTFGQIAERMPGRTVQSLINRYDNLREIDESMDVPAPTSPENAVDQSDGGSLGGSAVLATQTPVRSPDGVLVVGMPPANIATNAQEHGGFEPDAPEPSTVLTGLDHELLAAARSAPSHATYDAEKIDQHVLEPRLASDVPGVDQGFEQAIPSLVTQRSSSPGIAKVDSSPASPAQGGLLAPSNMSEEQPRTPLPMRASQPRDLTPQTTTLAGKRSSQHTPPIKPGARYSKAEHDLLIKMRRQGSKWIDIAAQLPGRSIASLSCYWSQHGKEVTHPDLASISREKPKKTLLRQTLDRSVRRIADGGRVPIILPDLASAKHSGHPGPMNLFNTLLRSSPVSARSLRAFEAPADDDVDRDEEVDFDFARLVDMPLGQSPRTVAHLAEARALPASSSPTLIRSPVEEGTGIGESSPVRYRPDTDYATPTGGLSAREVFRESIEDKRIMATAASPMRPDTPVRSAMTNDSGVLGGTPGAATPAGTRPAAPPPETPLPAANTPIRMTTRSQRTAATVSQAQTGPRPRLYGTPLAAAATQVPSARPAEPGTPLPARTPLAARASSAGISSRGGRPLLASTPFTAAPAPAFYSSPARYKQLTMIDFGALEVNRLSSPPVVLQYGNHQQPGESDSKWESGGEDASPGKENALPRIQRAMPAAVKSDEDLSERVLAMSDQVVGDMADSRRDSSPSSGAGHSRPKVGPAETFGHVGDEPSSLADLASNHLIAQHAVPLSSTDPLQSDGAPQHMDPSSTDPLQQPEDRAQHGNPTGSPGGNMLPAFTSDVLRMTGSSPATKDSNPSPTASQERKRRSKRQQTNPLRSSTRSSPRNRNQTPRMVSARPMPPTYPVRDTVKYGRLATNTDILTPRSGIASSRTSNASQTASRRRSTRALVTAAHESSEDELAL
ncbi:hypothetical protein LTR53_011112 [Teratosphaeriaceae sp. CCFEE 6253]|nr:hypothetical protein LTR53_011112 [Teratosphaeriaceae sp. CCFEE 6253]